MSKGRGSGEDGMLSLETAEKLYQKAPCGYISFQRNGNISNLNETLLSWLGYQREELVDVKKIQELLKIGSRIYFETHFFPLLKMQGFVKEINLELQRKDKSSFPGLLNVIEVKEEDRTGEETYWATIFDISDRKSYEKELIRAKQKAEDEKRKAEEAQQKAEEAFAAKARFLATISHEIRTPLNAILGIGNLFHKTELNNQQKEYAHILQVSSENLLELVNNVLDLSKIESGKVKLIQKPFVLSELVEGVTRTLEVKANEKNIELLSQIEKEVPPYLIGDAGKLNQVLTNLVGNAIKFTNEGGVYLEVSAKAREQDRVLLRFSVLDTGIGIPSDKLETVFGEFSQADYDVKEQYGGTGLGLTISQKLLGLQESQMQVKSELGQGSEFFFEIWYREGEAIQHEEEAVQSLPKEFKSARLLVVDDNPVNIYILGEFLQEWQLDYDSVESGQEAIEAMQKYRYDLLLMDLHMPGMTGYEASKAIRELELSQQPVIMALSASAQGDVSEKLRVAGMNDYVSKPFRPSELLDRLAHHLRHPEPEKFSFIPYSESPPQPTEETSAAVAAPKGFGVSRILKITGGRKDPLLKMLKTTARAIKGYEAEFKKAVENEDAKALRALIHKSTMTLYYAEADILKSLLEEVADALEEERREEEIAESTRKTFSEFARLHEALKSVDVKKVAREDVD